MYKVNSKKAINRLTRGALSGNKTRNIIAVAAIALTAMLFTALFTVGSGMIENIQRQTMRQAGGDGMAVLKYITDEQYEAVRDHELIDEISYNRLMCSSVNDPELIKRRGELYYMDDTAIKLGFCEPVEGHKPTAENEIMMDTTAIRLLGIEQRIGEPVTLSITVHGEDITREFVLSGWWEADPVFNASIMITSRAYMEAHADELQNTFGENGDMTGTINSYIMFKNSFGLQEKLERVITESGYSMDENAQNYIASNVNWSYLSTNFDLSPGIIAAALAGILVVVFTGYLIIYNVFQISVIKDIRFYGLLKTIGTTGRQIKKLIRRQAAALAVIGVPIGLILGYLIGKQLVPLIMEQSAYAASDYTTSANPVIFIGSAVFAVVTVFIGTNKPGRIAAKVSPVEAVRYTETADGKHKRRSARKGAGILRMAAANLGRNKKSAVPVIVSLSLSLVLFNTVYTFSLGFDMDKFLSKFVDSDFLIAHASYFSYIYSGTDTALSESMISAVSEQPGFTEGGRIYANVRDAEYFSVKTDDPAESDCVVYGLDDFPLGELEIIEGELDPEKLKSGKYIIEGVRLDDNNRPIWESAKYEIGDKVTLSNHRGSGGTAAQNEYSEYEYEVMAKAAIHYYTNSCGIQYSNSFYLPSEVYFTMVDDPAVMNYWFDVEDGGEDAMESFLKSYTETVEPMMSYSSKTTRASQFEGMRNMILVVGGSLSVVIGLIGVLNFVNSVMTSIISRRREFAVLSAVGMTVKQQRRMLILESLFCAMAAAAAGTALSAGFSALAAGTIAESLWFFTYKFTLAPVLASIPVLAAVSVILPVIVFSRIGKQSVVDRLRENEG